jgi:hypothetical protein
VLPRPSACLLLTPKSHARVDLKAAISSSLSHRPDGPYCSRSSSDRRSPQGTQQPELMLRSLGGFMLITRRRRSWLKAYPSAARPPSVA